MTPFIFFIPGLIGMYFLATAHPIGACLVAFFVVMAIGSTLEHNRLLRENPNGCGKNNCHVSMGCRKQRIYIKGQWPRPRGLD